MKFYVLQKCFDIMEIMYSFVAANLVRRYCMTITLRFLYNLIYHKIFYCYLRSSDK